MPYVVGKLISNKRIYTCHADVYHCCGTALVYGKYGCGDVLGYVGKVYNGGV
jgi:hypothetical protein